jgi:hypothetical protein
MRSHPNGMLATLSSDELEQLRPYLTTTDLHRGAVLVEAGDVVRRAYFPQSGVVSLVVRLSDGHMIETGMVGREPLRRLSSAQRTYRPSYGRGPNRGDRVRSGCGTFESSRRNQREPAHRPGTA